MNQKPTPLYTTNSYPLWLTKNIIIYVKGENFAKNIDWLRSSRNCLYVKNYKFVDTLKNMHFYYPDGELFDFKESHEYYEQTQHQTSDDDNDDTENIDDTISPEDYWFEN
ncbi:lef-6 [Clostera anastomosis granulovirus B]|uniref:Lef-6 n=1 Tax=Clostera anastomosis granulovirus B TaxID=1986290 RepID=A0A0K0WSL0_9BBAC|nr:lef-6 [Clostera anastomosis granulovirus B]AKS25408.1 lef-6 [Clostera anastomosis granulovirus B]